MNAATVQRVMRIGGSHDVTSEGATTRKSGGGEACEYVFSAISDDPPRWLEKWRPMTERGARMVVDHSAIKHRFAERRLSCWHAKHIRLRRRLFTITEFLIGWSEEVSEPDPGALLGRAVFHD
jgi:hypothetical protein